MPHGKTGKSRMCRSGLPRQRALRKRLRFMPEKRPYGRVNVFALGEMTARKNAQPKQN
jgi:hypothetical protein